MKAVPRTALDKARNCKVLAKHEIMPSMMDDNREWRMTYHCHAIQHPRLDDQGKPVIISKPTIPSAPESWPDPKAVAVFVPDGSEPAAMNGVAFAPWTDHPINDDMWRYVDGQMDDLDEPVMRFDKDRPPASGCVIEEPDGRVWLVSPSNAFGGYTTTYPKGKLDGDQISPQANAIKEAFEESGLKAQITGYLGDFKRGTSITRLYLARRVGGSPSAVGWESQAVCLVPRTMLDQVAAHRNDKEINGLLKASTQGV
ncbi:NUDIX hydrolase [Candidatus Accumulibacter phosphatis]|uniref:NUDIX hydrolase n=1 Tax=Candidatus Accumulibacter phosphatis TaxID=327160 RepID=UPI00110B94EC|nr:NUDIX hydrolase [Candidatus Accumulibacter phosphatis]